ncbi:MAG TPA: response regulator transcription factor [Solirubrobacteraceae bacterium]|jgi:DNA-binding NarL/FixJ family response regulator|nr:response regulator transcription factor [Solirubrobacteraceae bacterium]
MEKSLKVLIADDHPLLLQGIRRALDASEDIDVVGEARTGDELLALVKRRKPHLVLLDLRMPGLGGLECISEIKRSWPEIKTVVISACEDRASIDSALLAGASAYMVKSVSPLDIPSVLRQAATGVVYHAPSAAPTWDSEQPVAAGPGLTPRETAILKAIADGLTTKAISQELWLSEHTVKFHLTNIYRKLGVSNRSAAVKYAFENDLASSPLAAVPA